MNYNKLNKNKIALVLAFVLVFVGGVGAGLFFSSSSSKVVEVQSVSTSQQEPPELELDEEDEEDKEAIDVAGDGKLPEMAEAQEETPEPELSRNTVGKGETVSRILEPWIGPSDLATIVEKCKKVFPLNRVRAGQSYTICTVGDKFIHFEYDIDNDNKLFIVYDGTEYTVAKVAIEYQVSLHKVEGVINSNLFQSMTDINESAALAINLANVFAWEINFIRDLRAGDSFTALVEKRYLDGEFKGYGRLLAATFTNQGKTYEAYAFTDASNSTLYYNKKGDSMRRAFLKAPLSFTRISSGYSNRRFHPITKTWKSHPAIDYAAPQGTPIKTVGKGEITYIGFQKYSGNHIKIKHLNGYETIYLHMSAFAKGLKKGTKVEQGQVIGFVGKTGLATGPHLCFRMRKSGQPVNPISELSPRDTPVTKKERPLFEAQVGLCRDFMDGKRPLTDYSRELMSKALEQ